MSLQEAEQQRRQQRSQRARRKHQKQNKRKRVKAKRRASTLDAPFTAFATSHPNQVLTFRQWCRLNAISPRTGRRIIKGGHGPVVTQLSPQRIGISIENNALWQASRARVSPAA
jgi:hypothetical protein